MPRKQEKETLKALKTISTNLLKINQTLDKILSEGVCIYTVEPFPVTAEKENDN